MRRRTLSILLIGGSLCLAPLVWFQHTLDQRNGRHWTREAERAANRLCRALRATDLVLADGPAAAAPPGTDDLLQLVDPEGLERIPSLPAGTVAAPPLLSALPARPAAELRRCPPAPGLAAATLLRASADRSGVLYLGAADAAGTGGGAGWIRLDGASLLGRPQEGLRLVALAPWPGAGPPLPAATRVWRVVHGPHSLLLALAHVADPDERLERSLAWALGGLGLLLTALLAFTAEQQWLRRHRLLRSLRHDPPSGLLSRYALERDLELPPIPAAADPAQALLLTLDFPVLDRQRLFLDEADRLAILNTAASALRRWWPGAEAAGGELPIYRANDHRIAAILPPSAVPESHDRPTLETVLAELLQAVSAAIEELGSLHLNWDDIRVTGQWFPLQGTRSPLLALQAFGDLAPGAEPRAVRLLDPADEWQAREDAELRRQLIALTAKDIDLRFQPILLLADPGCFALELLLRFRSPLLRRLGTGAVLQAARAMGIAHRIDDLVVDQLPGVQERLQASPLLRERITYISFNVSADSLASEDRLARLVERLQQRAVDVSVFRIEITEMAAAGTGHPGAVGMASASERLMRELNLRVLIDDFGSGLSNYRRISEAWYDAIKLDIELIRGIGQSFRLQRYVGSFIAAVHGLGKTIVAEGIERYADLVVAVRQGADALQGFHIAPPLPWDELEGFLTGSEWASGHKIQRLIQRIAASDRMLDATGLQGPALEAARVPLERYILDNWSGLRSFEEFVLLFVNELRSWGLEVHRFSLAFLPDQDAIDCSQYIWLSRAPADVQALRMPREFLEREEHLSSPLHHIALHGRLFRYRFDDDGDRGFPFLTTLRADGCTDYLGLRLESRGVSIPVLTIALKGGSGFQDAQIQRIEAMSSLLSLLFYAFESERARRLARPLDTAAGTSAVDHASRGAG